MKKVLWDDYYSDYKVLWYDWYDWYDWYNWEDWEDWYDYYSDYCEVEKRKEEKKMTKVLWFSRHEMTEEQLSGLKKNYGAVEVQQINRTIKSAYELKAEVEAADVVAIVAPINLQAQFLKLAGDKPVIMAKSKRILNGDGSKVTFAFDGWQQILKIEVVYKPL